MISSHSDVFFDQLRDIHSAEDQIGGTIPDLAGWATDSSLQSLLERHHQAIRRDLVEIERIFESHGVERGQDLCKAVQGLVEGGNEHIGQAADPIIRDLLLIAHGSRIGHYQIAAHGFTRAVARRAGFAAEAELLADMLEERRALLHGLAQIGTHQFGVPMESLQEAAPAATA